MTRLSFLRGIHCVSSSVISKLRCGGVSRVNRTPACVVALAAICAWLVPSLAMAQSASYFDRDNNVSVLQRPRPDYQALGVDLGAFQLFPSVTTTEAYDDNIFATSTGRVSDWITTVNPTLDLKSNWSRDSLELTATDSSNLYAGTSSEDTNDYSVNMFSEIDAGTDSSFSGSVGYGHYHIARTSEVSFGDSVNPVQYDGLNANLGAIQTLNRLRFSESVAYFRTMYDDAVDQLGTPLPFSQDDGSQIVGDVRASYAISPDIALFVDGVYNVRSYDDLPPVTLLDRNSNGYEATVGADFDITRLVRGQVQVGYLSQHYESPIFHPVQGPDVHARVEYFLSGLTTITLHANRTIIDDVDPVAVSYLQTEGGVQVDHELLRNVLLAGKLNYEDDDFTGVQRDDRRTTASARATYLLNQHLGLTAGYSFIDVRSSGPARVGSYDANVLSLSLTLQL
jgi:hypothetical protein